MDESDLREITDHVDRALLIDTASRVRYTARDIERIGALIDGLQHHNDALLEALALIKEKLKDLYARVDRLDRLVSSPPEG